MEFSTPKKLSKLQPGFQRENLKLAREDAVEAEVLRTIDAVSQQFAAGNNQQCAPDKCWDCTNVLC